MKFIPYQPAGDPTLEVVLGIIAVALVVLSVIVLVLRALIFGGGKGYMKTAVIVAPFLFIGIAGTGIIMGLSVTHSVESTRAHTDKIRSEISATYRIDANAEQIYDLGYPSELPSTRFEAFGSTELKLPTKGGFEEREVYLIWSDGALALAKSPDGGKSFDVLKPAAK